MAGPRTETVTNQPLAPVGWGSPLEALSFLHFWVVLLLLPVESGKVVSGGTGEVLGRKQKDMWCVLEKAGCQHEVSLSSYMIICFSYRWNKWYDKGCDPQRHLSCRINMISLDPKSVGILRGRLRFGAGGGRFVLQFCFLRLVFAEKKERSLDRMES